MKDWSWLYLLLYILSTDAVKSTYTSQLSLRPFFISLSKLNILVAGCWKSQTHLFTTPTYRKMITFSQAAQVVLLLTTTLTTINADPISTTTVQYPLIASAQLSSPITQGPLNTTFLTSITASPTLPDLASMTENGSIQARGFRDQWPTSLGGPDCIEDHDDRCFCCKWRHPAKPAACGKMKCCPCINHVCDPKDLKCTPKVA